MSLKKLNHFAPFDLSQFLTGKQLETVGCREWRDFDTKRLLGTKVEVVITVDKTDYGADEGEFISNIYEKLTVKVPKIGFNVPMNTKVRLINANATVYGDRRDQLSIIANDIEVIGK